MGRHLRLGNHRSVRQNSAVPRLLSSRSLRATCAVLGLLGVIARAQDLPDAIHVRDRIGQQVEFQDKVEAVSYSRSTNGYYLSFGGAYPAQVLSVWASEKNYDQLPGRSALVGRVVRIKGQIEGSSTGPLIKLESPEAFQLLQVEESALTKAVLDGKMDRDQFKAAVEQKFAAEDFGTLEVLAEELRQSRERFTDGTWLSAAFQAAFELDANASSERYAAAGQTIAHWETARPGSLVALLVRAGWHRDLAWKARSHETKKKIAPEQIAAFTRELIEARQLLQSHPAAGMYPEYFSLLQRIALSQGWEKDEYLRLFEEATRREPEYYTFYFNTAQYLLPRWRGKKGEWEAFADAQRVRLGSGPAGDALYARIVWAMKPFYDDLFATSNVSWETMASGFEFLIKEHPQSRWLKNAYPYFAWKARDRVRLAKALPEIRQDPDMNIWVNLENLGMAERLAASER